MKITRPLFLTSAKLFLPAKLMGLLFFLGLLLGAGVHFLDHSVFGFSDHRSEEKTSTSSTGRFISRIKTVFAGKHIDDSVFGKTETKSLPAQPSVVQTQIEKERTIRKGLSFGKGLSLLLAAIRDPKSEDFNLIRGEFLQSVPNYSSILLPPLKETALNVMVGSFRKSDWEAWPKVSLLNNGVSTPARQYVDSITAQNRELGLFLETSALLLHGLYVTTNHGRGYDLAKGFDYLVGSAEKLVGDGNLVALPAKYLLSYSVPSDPSFLPTFEKIRSSLVAQYVSLHPDELERNLRLISSLDGRYQTAASNEQLSKALLRLSIDGTPRFRKQIVDQLIASGQLDQVFLLSSKVKVSAAQLEAVAAVDALEAKDILSAKKLLSHSLSLATGLPAQKLVGDFLREYGFGWVRPSLTSLEARELGTTEFGEDAGGSRFTIFGVSMILLLLVGGILGVVFVKKKLEENDRLSGPSSLYFEPGSSRTTSVLVPDAFSPSISVDNKVAELPRKVVNYNQYSD